MIDLATLLPDQAERLGDAPFVTIEGAVHSFGSVDQLAARVAGALERRGVGANDTVATRCPNALTQLAIWFACHRLGATFVPLNLLTQGGGARSCTVHRAAGTGRRGARRPQNRSELGEFRSGRCTTR